jgi:hypothetical protein
MGGLRAPQRFPRRPDQVAGGAGLGPVERRLPRSPRKREQLGEDRAKRGRNTEDKGQPYGTINDP